MNSNSLELQKTSIYQLSMEFKPFGRDILRSLSQGGGFVAPLNDGVRGWGHFLSHSAPSFPPLAGPCALSRSWLPAAYSDSMSLGHALPATHVHVTMPGLSYLCQLEDWGSPACSPAPSSSFPRSSLLETEGESLEE